MINLSSLTVCKDTRLNDTPKLTLVLCCYNQGAYVAEAIDAAIKVKALITAEILFIDDGSKDDSVQQALSSLVDSTDYLVATKQNSGLVHSLNSGLQLARGELIVFIASDDRLRPAELVSACERLAQLKEAQFFLGNAQYFGDLQSVRPVYGALHQQFFESDASVRQPATPSKLPSPLLLQATVFKTDYLRQLNGWDADVVLDDLPMFIRMFASRPVANKNFLFALDLMISDYRLHPGGNSRRLINQYLLCLQCITRYCPVSVQRQETIKILCTYLLNALRAGDLEALKFLISAAFRTGALTATIHEMVARVSNKIFAKLTTGH